ncbi:MAG: PEGA domain-containing protein [Deltaproteobacteria bacterium]|nr:PEGA domain-containing protein [Deltaproteobacteria bacterium]
MRLRRMLLATTVLCGAPVALAQPRPALRTVNINSQPPGATVTLDAATGTVLGPTPLRRQRVPAGPHSLFFTLDGYAPGRLDVTVTRNNETWTAQLAQLGSITVTCPTAGATVLVDNHERGTLPAAATVTGVIPGSHTVELRAPGMQPFVTTVTVSPGQGAAVAATLTPVPQAAPTTGGVRLVIVAPTGRSVPAGLQALFDGAPMQGAPPTVEGVPAGGHVVEVRAPGFRNVVRDVPVVAGPTQTVRIDLEDALPTTGSVRFDLQVTGAAVTVDGQAVQGATAENLSEGDHVVRVELAGRAPLQRTVTVRAGQSTTFAVTDADLRPARATLVVTTTTPGATLAVEGVERPGPRAEFTDLGPGPHVVLVRAPGYDERRQECTGAMPGQPAAPCALELERSVERGSLRVSSRTPNAQVTVDAETTPRPLGDVGGLAVGAHRVTVSARGYRPETRSVEVRRGDNPALEINLRRDGLSEADVASRRASVTSWGALPLASTDFTFDMAFGFGLLPLEVRATTGLLPRTSLLGADLGIGFRTRGDWQEMELRGRGGIRPHPLLSAGVEARLWAVLPSPLSIGAGSGFASQVNVTIHLQPRREEGDDSDVQALNYLGMNLSAHLGFEYANDSISQGRDLYVGGVSLCENSAARQMQLSAMQPLDTCVISSTTRGFLGLLLEVSASRHWNVFGGFDYWLAPPVDPTMAVPPPGSGGARRALTANLWGAALPMFARLGATYKF